MRIVRESQAVHVIPEAGPNVEAWMEDHGHEAPYYDGPKADAEDEDQIDWFQRVHGANLLSALFKDLSEHRYIYDKVTYGVALTNWLVAHAPDELAEVAALLKRVLPSGADSVTGSQTPGGTASVAS